MTEWQVYLWLKLTDLIVGLALLGGLGACVGLVWCIISHVEDAEKVFKRNSIIVLVGSLLLCGIAIVFPTTRQYAMVKVFPKIVNSEVVQEIPADMVDMYSMAKSYMKEMLSVDTDTNDGSESSPTK